MKILFIGDVVSEPGRQILNQYLNSIKVKYDIDFTIVNGENVAHGHGITKDTYAKLLSIGADAITLGNHFLSASEKLSFLDEAELLVRPLNVHKSVPGSGSKVFNVKGHEVRVTNILGRTFIDALNPTNPFDAIDDLLENNKTKIHIIDFHAEATAEKLTLGWYLDGKVSAVLGTHTHVQTADNRLLANGTAYISDVGMTGPYDGIIGATKEPVIKRAITGLPSKFDIEKGRTQLSGVVLDINPETGLANSIIRIYINPDHLFID